MKVRIILIAALALAAVSCGSNNSKSVSAAPAAVTPNVEVTTAVARDVPQEGTYASTIMAYAVNNIMPQQGSRIRKINVEVGDYVQQGQILAEMDRTQLDQLELQVRNDEQEYERIKTLYEEGAISQSDFETSELSYKVRKTNYENVKENTVLRSPISGFVTVRNFDRGDMFSMGSPLFVIHQVIPVKLLIGISESEYTKVKKGDQVQITVDALPGKVFTGKVERLYPIVDSATHTFKVEVTIPNKDKVLLPGMYARATVNFGSIHNVVVPDQAIVRMEGTGQRFVYVLNANNTVSLVPVTPGRHIGSEYEIVEGLADGAKVVVKGQSTLKDGMNVNVLN
jgi:RND family efflux transporter MFP subunit